MEEFDPAEHFLKMLRTGQFKVTKNGNIISEGVHMVFFPALTLAKLCKEVDPKILYELGLYQAEKAIKLHTKFFGFSIVKVALKLSKGLWDKILDYMVRSWVVDGWGKIEIPKYDPKKKEMVIINRYNPVAKSYLRDFGKSDRPIDWYFVGLIEGLAKAAFGKAECREVKCIAMGDPYCEFILRWD